MDFRIRGLPAEHFTHLFALSDAQLAARGAIRLIADERPVFPCRVSLTDAPPGVEVLLVHYEHHPVASPYRASYAIYVRAGEQTFSAQNDVPEQLRQRLLALRAYNERAMLIDSVITEGALLESSIERMLANERTAYVHAHYAKAGCYAALIERA